MSKPLINPDALLLTTPTQTAETIRSVIVPALNMLAKANKVGKEDIVELSNAMNSGRPGGFASSIPSTPDPEPQEEIAPFPAVTTVDGEVVSGDPEDVKTA